MRNRKDIFAIVFALLTLLSCALPAIAFTPVDFSGMPGSEFSTFDRKEYADPEQYALNYSSSAYATFTRNGLIPDDKIYELPGSLEGYTRAYFDICYRNIATNAATIEQYGSVYHPIKTSNYENVVEPGGYGLREWETWKSDGTASGGTEEKGGPFTIDYSQNINRDTYPQTVVNSLFARIMPQEGAYIMIVEHNDHIPVEEYIAENITKGRAEGKEILTAGKGELPDSYIEFTKTDLDQERTLYTLHTVKHDPSSYDFAFDKSGNAVGYSVPEKRYKEELDESWEYWTVYQPKAFPEVYVVKSYSLMTDIEYDNGKEGGFKYLASERLFELAEKHDRQVKEVNAAVLALMSEPFTLLATDPYTANGVYIEKQVTNKADNKADEDDGISIPEIIVLGLLGAAAAAAGAAGSEGKGSGSTYKMTFRKDFGDTLDRDGPPLPVYARIIEVKENGLEVPRDDLTARITAFSDDHTLEVQPYGVRDGYLCATVKVPAGSTFQKATVSFRFEGEGGAFTRHIVFKIDEARIAFLQENLGLPAEYDKESKLPFVLVGLPDNAAVSAEIRSGENEDVYALTLEQDGEYPTLWYAHIAEKAFSAANADEKKKAKKALAQREKKPAGTTEGYTLHVCAACGEAGEEGSIKKEADFPIYRIWLGLALVMESTGIGCYMRVKPDRVGIARESITARDLEPCMTEASLMLLDWDEGSHSIVRVALLPKMTEKERKEGKGIALKITPKKVENDRYAHVGDADESHQKLVDALGIKAFPTGEVYSNGAYKLRICATAGAMDPPTRLLAEIEVTASYKGKDYSVKRDVLLRSQDFRHAKDTSEELRQIVDDQHIRERLEHIMTLIWNNYMDRLFSLYNLIDRMIDGYDARFGFDENQVANVLEIWTGFIEGRHMGANGEAEKLTFADELKACYAFMQGLRDNTGILGRIAMGVMTAGYSEYVFTAMTLGEEIYERVMTCKGDEEFGCWDAVVMCVKEFEKQIIMEYAMMGAGLAAKGIAKETGGVIDVFKAAEAAGAKYRATIDKWDRALCKSSAVYKKGADALNKVTNYFNSLARSAGNGIKQSADEAGQAAAKAEQKIAAGKQKLSPSEMKAVEEYDLAMAEGLNKVQKLKEAQQKLARTKGAGKEAARAEYRRAANEVWSDKNALKQLQRSKDSYAKNMRYEFNQYREGMLNRVEEKAMDDIAAEWGIPREELYVSNATSNQNIDYYNKIPGDRDTTINRIVNSGGADRSMDISLSQDWGEKAMARNLYKEIHGVEPPSIGEALKFMKGKDVTYVCPEGAYYMNHVIEPNMNAYADLGGMIGLTRNGIDKSLLNQNLKGLALNQKTVAYKGKEWFTRDANESIAKAAECEKAALSLSGAAKEAKLAEARTWRYKAQADKVEGVRQITKQFDKIIDVRNTYSVARGNSSAITAQVREIHAIALRVGDDLPPVIFEKILHENYGLTLDDYADMMAKCLV